ncbi:DUF7940 domain-containing protein [Roseibium sp. Sym1]|uniref:DUF7940 domain-containing protein n=1 Tax=Roseibium sp. Sym1 TaxID=3016006 RepID=UPI0022B36737|nr:hypothetical protein [Roseibium sp. Sym1]
MKFIKDWRQVLRWAWSVRLMGLAALLSAVEAVSPHLGGVLAPGQLALVSALATTGAVVARILVQKDLDHGT